MSKSTRPKTTGYIVVTKEGLPLQINRENGALYTSSHATMFKNIRSAKSAIRRTIELFPWSISDGDRVIRCADQGDAP